MPKRLVFVHGRAQEKKDPVAIKREWVDSWRKGLAKSGLSLPIAEDHIALPFYGDILYDLVHNKSNALDPGIIFRGEPDDAEEREFKRQLLEEIRQHANITTEQLVEIAGAEVIEKGPLNWGWVQTILQSVDRFIPGGSGVSVALFTNDVFQYLKRPAVQDRINAEVRKAIPIGEPFVLVSHSLGTVVAYSLLRREGDLQGWQIPQFITLGSPLGIGVIRNSFRPIKHPGCAGAWYNAMDDRDVVALYPLDEHNFDVDPAIQNKTNVDNFTENRHGISGYLSDAEVARRIHDALL